jgi:hypothetical protein
MVAQWLWPDMGLSVMPIMIQSHRAANKAAAAMHFSGGCMDTLF